MVGRSIEPEADDDQSVNDRIREEMARRRISRQTLADKAKISLSTLEKALAGQRPFTLATLIRLEEALGIRLRPSQNHPASPTPSPGSQLAPDDLGGYSRGSVAWLEGRYLTLRSSFSDRQAIFAYRTEISWSQNASCLIFQESDRLDHFFTQEGCVSVPNMSGHIYLATNKHGQHRLIVVSRPAISGEMYGILTTLHAGRGASLMPVSAAIVLVPEKTLETVQYGKVTETHPLWQTYRAYLNKVVDDVYVGFYGSKRV